MGLKNAVFMSDTFVSSYSSHACYSGWINLFLISLSLSFSPQALMFLKELMRNCNCLWLLMNSLFKESGLMNMAAHIPKFPPAIAW